MKVTKAEAKERNMEDSYICPFHEKHPDQSYAQGLCADCIWIEDPCGCGVDEGCEECCPEDFKGVLK